MTIDQEAKDPATTNGGAASDRRSCRRVVTGSTRDGRSAVVADEELPLREVPGAAHVSSTFLWQTSDPVVLQREPREWESFRYGVAPATGTFVLLSHFAPYSADAEWTGFPDSVTLEAGIAQREMRRGFHRTDSVDYCVVISGELTAVLDEEAVTLRPGDVLVQQGVAHAWANRGSEPCLVAFVMIAGTRRANAGGPDVRVART